LGSGIRTAEERVARISQSATAIAISEPHMPMNHVISILDDDPSVREGTMDMLNSMGFVAISFERADEFLEFDRLYSTACLIADMRLPGMTGLELYEHMLESDKAVPTILVTAFPDDRDRARALRAGVLCYLIKPFNESELLACIRSALKLRQTNSKGC
jgi:FixJ family two-component response regulator